MHRVSRQDSADLGFAWACLMAGAVTFDEFKAWAERVVAETPSDALPPHMIDVMMAADRRDVTAHLPQLIGFLPSDPLLEEDAASGAVMGLSVLRGTFRPEDVGLSAYQSRTALDHRPDVLNRFRDLFGDLVSLEGAAP